MADAGLLDEIKKLQVSRRLLRKMKRQEKETILTTRGLSVSPGSPTPSPKLGLYSNHIMVITGLLYLELGGSKTLLAVSRTMEWAFESFKVCLGLSCLSFALIPRRLPFLFCSI